MYPVLGTWHRVHLTAELKAKPREQKSTLELFKQNYGYLKEKGYAEDYETVVEHLSAQ